VAKSKNKAERQADKNERRKERKENLKNKKGAGNRKGK